MKDVAKRADVSVATVSRYLNGFLDLPDQTRGRIDRAVADLDYRPNPHARRLSLGRSDTIALIIPDIANPFFSRMAAAIEACAAERGRMVTLHATMNRTDREMAALDNAHRNLVDGLVFMTNHMPPAKMAEMINRFSRAVILDEIMEGVRAPHILCDNEQGGFLAGKCLREAGHSRVAYIGGRGDLVSTSARLQGLQRGLASDTPLRSYATEHAAASGRELAQRFLNERDGETALFVGSDELTVGVIEVFHDRGIRVPDDISLVSFDNVRSLHLFAPAITAVEQPVDAMGRRAIEMLFDGDWDDPNFVTSREVLPVRLIDRQSVNTPPAYPSATPEKAEASA
ncbi:MAG: LacI family DNA-binding transcriptional regulator [Pseudomonadota bacterium]